MILAQAAFAQDYFVQDYFVPLGAAEGRATENGKTLIF